MNDKAEWLPTLKDIDKYELLKEILFSQKKEFDILSKKKADDQLNPMKIKIANRVLEPLKELFKHEEVYQFLDTINEDDLPTNSDVVLILSQYETAVTEFRNKYFVIDEYRGGFSSRRWMTQEFPPDYYADENEEDYEEDER